MGRECAAIVDKAKLALGGKATYVDFLFEGISSWVGVEKVSYDATYNLVEVTVTGTGGAKITVPGDRLLAYRHRPIRDME